ncbi:MAG: hypothetical protein KA978_14855 [Deltaproteobacteria bacterium]|nr:hypothetical protein [Deltaproteobacteria bacterium]
MHIIASGQEELIRRIVAPPLPPGWEFAGARIEGATVVARYGRPADRAVAVMTLAHPAASESAVTTRRFAVHWRLSPGARDAAALARAVVVSVRATEEGFVWTLPVAPPTEAPPPPSPPPAAPPPDPALALIEEALAIIEAAPSWEALADGSTLTAAADEWGNVVLDLARPDGGRLEARLGSAQRSVVATWLPVGADGSNPHRHPQSPDRWFAAAARVFPHLAIGTDGPPPSHDAVVLDPVGVADLLAPDVALGGDAFAGHRLVAVRIPRADGAAASALGRVRLEFSQGDAGESLEVVVAPAEALDPVFASHAGVGVGMLHFGLADRGGAKARAALLCSHLAALIARRLGVGARVVVPSGAAEVRLLDGRAAPALACDEVLNLNLDAECGQRCTFCPIKSFVPARDGGAQELESLRLQIQSAAARGQRRARLNGIDPLAFSRVLDLASALRDAGFESLEVMGPGRRFADDGFRAEFLRRSPAHTEVVVPLYGVTADVHDAVTNAPGSHAEVLRALDGLGADLAPGRLGLATVITRQNVDGFADLVRFARARGLTLWPQLPYPLRQTRHGAYADSALPESEIVARVLRSLHDADADERAACLFALANAIRHPCVLWRAERSTGLGAFEAARTLPRRSLAGVAVTDEHDPRGDGGARSLTTLHVVRSPCPEAGRCALLPACAGDHYAAYGERFGLDEFVAVGVWDLAAPGDPLRSGARRG